MGGYCRFINCTALFSFKRSYRNAIDYLCLYYAALSRSNLTHVEGHEASDVSDLLPLLTTQHPRSEHITPN
jgi:hypothetical protein